MLNQFTDSSFSQLGESSKGQLLTALRAARWRTCCTSCQLMRPIDYHRLRKKKLSRKNNQPEQHSLLKSLSVSSKWKTIHNLCKTPYFQFHNFTSKQWHMDNELSCTHQTLSLTYWRRWSVSSNLRWFDNDERNKHRRQTPNKIELISAFKKHKQKKTNKHRYLNCEIVFGSHVCGEIGRNDERNREHCIVEQHHVIDVVALVSRNSRIRRI